MKSIFSKRTVIIVVFISIIFIIIGRKWVMGKLSRGMRNNNPFNLNKTASKWLGQVEGKDERFCVFSELKYGIRAGLINLYNGYFSKNLTLRQIVGRYAPASDGNDEKAYIDSITRRTGIIAEQIPGKDKWLSVASAIMYHENGFNVMVADNLSGLVKDFKLVNYM